MPVLAVIPARYGSTRFPGKPLALLQGKPIIQHVYEQAAKARHVDEVVVATDDGRIEAAVRAAGGQVAMTSPAARSGTERAAEVARTRSAEVILNLQGDEPLVRPEMIDQVAQFLVTHRTVPMASLMVPLRSREEAESSHVVKVVVDRDGFALYFSRAAIPHERTPGSGVRCHKHVGLYGFQRHFLLQFPALEPTPLERAESLEQLRALEHGHKIKLLETQYDTIGVDTPEDLRRIEARLAGAAA